MAKAILPLIDLVFLTLGSVLAMMTQMERVTAMPVTLAEVGQGSAVVQRGDFDVLTVSAEDCWGLITHEVEALFKAAARALDDATRLDERRSDTPSTKGDL